MDFYIYRPCRFLRVGCKKVTIWECYVLVFSLCYLLFLFYGTNYEVQVPGAENFIPVSPVQYLAKKPTHVPSRNTTVSKESESPSHFIRLSYSPAYNKSNHGKAFFIDVHTLTNLGLLRKSYIKLNEENVKDFVFATAANRDYFEFLQDTVASIQMFKPEHKIYVYDLGLNEDQILQMSSWCNIQYRKFDFDWYPPHVRKVGTYAWKPIAIAETLKESPGVLWLDSSGRVLTSNFTLVLQKVLKSEALSITSTGHSTFAATHPQMYKYLPGNIETFKREEQWEGTFLFYATRSVITRILRWVVVCALRRTCIAPTLTRYCQFKDNDHFRQYADCHRFDQSAFSIVMLNHFNGSSTSFYTPQKIIEIQRYHSGKYAVSAECYGNKNIYE